ncbi:right-handed parallel beta-helix repeat-containing protein [Nonomuraea sp. 3-1Str]|uniref:right-handed parallel beta-helix repeat-containing protein n=1 Tax=Nonomuraea sp. 3-1Str TaxID=2929801 RepID=UPI002860C00B|nr:right-handed parallel beta-helix repeat-containing protein [Nonomuraea sp. 3-1Str]MDR8411920.1 right-handed parallel beta-helix repeat-containing protein [Nonomuraea sp. 3-1Str]
MVSVNLSSVTVLASLLPGLPAAPAVPVLPPAAAAVAAGTTYYVDSGKGDDSAAGTSATAPWKSLDKVNAADLKPGDAISVKRGSRWTGTLTLSAEGTAARPIVVQPYGQGPLATISGQEGNCVVVSGDHWRVSGLRASRCQWAGFEVGGDGNHLVGVQADRNIAGIWITPTGSRNVVRDSTLKDNDRMSVNDDAPDNDSGAFGILVNGDDNLVTGNTITGSNAPSHDYRMDGAAVEIFDGDRNRVTYNRAHDNETFTELGATKGKTATGNVYAFNVVTSSLPQSSFLVTRGPRHVVGPVLGTVAVHNSVYLPGPRTLGWSCHGGCSPSILRLRNNAVRVGGQAGFEDGKGADEAGSVYEGRTARFRRGPGTVMADPRFVSRTDLRLRPGSPALGRGLPLSAAWFGGTALTTDITGKPLSSPPAAGAYQP